MTEEGGGEIFVGHGISKEIFQSGPSEVLLILGQGVKPQLRQGASKERRVVIGSAYDSQILRAKTVAAAELVAHGLIDGPIVPTGANTASADSIKAAREKWNNAVEPLKNAELISGTEPYAVVTANPKLSLIEKQELIGNPHTDEEMQRVAVTTEAGLMAEFLQKAQSKSHDVLRKKQSPIWKEEKARNTVQNVIYLLNMLDEKYGHWDGKVQVLSSNDGHVDRGVAVLRAFGFTNDHIVPIAAETVLEKYQYQQSFLNRLTAEERKDERLLGQGKWLEMIKRVPAYMLPELTKITNDKRLLSVVSALQEWYKQSRVDMLGDYPQLASYKSMNIGMLRTELGQITRDTNTAPWEKYIDYDNMRQQIKDNSLATAEWMERQKVT